MKTALIPSSAVCAFVASISVPTSLAASDAQLAAALADKTLIYRKAAIKTARDGRMTGKVGPQGAWRLDGAWEIKDGKFCGTVKRPVAFAGTRCSNMELTRDSMTISGFNGNPVKWKIQ
ncbi:hypothetical protein SAMN04488118_10338 [Epibacterium ulvae]|uniref:Uncharacterized protein n=1 Tax=Epibacterium ulvae TaxID=1156985 RepID=A0A1G5Q6T0_9RHOB|nr:hypothetical protein [Epibacterium ulvae]SCZ57170.1 hypothetical protein SAMN04488118_10338 [Epibacterium ulvae]